MHDKIYTYSCIILDSYTFKTYTAVHILLVDAANRCFNLVTLFGSLFATLNSITSSNHQKGNDRLCHDINFVLVSRNVETSSHLSSLTYLWYWKPEVCVYLPVPMPTYLNPSCTHTPEAFLYQNPHTSNLHAPEPTHLKPSCTSTHTPQAFLYLYPYGSSLCLPTHVKPSCTRTPPPHTHTPQTSLYQYMHASCLPEPVQSYLKAFLYQYLHISSLPVPVLRHCHSLHGAPGDLRRDLNRPTKAHQPIHSDPSTVKERQTSRFTKDGFQHMIIIFLSLRMPPNYAYIEIGLYLLTSGFINTVIVRHRGMK